MSKRTRRQRTKHNRAVQESLEYYKDEGYDVRADLPGYKKKPGLIIGKRPDLVARKGRNVVMVEVETRETLGRDKKQQEVFKKHAKVNRTVRFWTKLAK